MVRQPWRPAAPGCRQAHQPSFRQNPRQHQPNSPSASILPLAIAAPQATRRPWRRLPARPPPRAPSRRRTWRSAAPSTHRSCSPRATRSPRCAPGGWACSGGTAWRLAGSAGREAYEQAPGRQCFIHPSSSECRWQSCPKLPGPAGSGQRDHQRAPHPLLLQRHRGAFWQCGRGGGAASAPAGGAGAVGGHCAQAGGSR